MSAETMQWLFENTLIGFTAKRGNAWHWRAAQDGERTNHYTDAIPVGDVVERLFHWKAVEVELYRAAGLSGDGFVPVAGRKMIARDDTYADLGVHREGYQIHQYRDWLLTGLSNILDDGLAVSSAGLLKGGAVAWVQVETPETVTTAEGFSFRPFILACSSHDGSLASTFMAGSQAVVCDNTLSMALSEGGPTKRFRHTSKSGLRVHEAREALGILHKQTDDFTAQVEGLASWEVSDAELAKFLDEWAPVPEAGKAKPRNERRRDLLNTMYVSDPRVAPWKGTALGVLQLANTYTTHEKPVRGTVRPERNMIKVLTGEAAEEDAGVLRLLAAVTGRS
jgi:phage/plasmid-like protein (TIGR03299 family)